MNVVAPLLFYASFIFIVGTGEIIPANILLFLLELWGIFLVLTSSMYLGVRLLYIQTKHLTLLTSGPFALIRHPMYLGLFLISLALVWDYPTVAYGSALVVELGAMLVQIDGEEQYLARKYKSKFLKYAQKTKKLIPFIY